MDEPAFAVVGELSVGKNISVHAKGCTEGLAFHALSMVTVRHERPKDLAAIRSVNERAFGRPTEAGLVAALRKRGQITLSLVAVQEGRVVGHILFSPVIIESDNEIYPAVGLGPMAVLPELQRQGIGSALIKTGLKECREAGHERVVVLGHAEYYPRFGFIPARRYGVRCEYDVPDEIFMVLELRKGAFQGKAGTVKYQPEFNEV